MGFYVRKSVKAGPFRFNMSKSGLGVSAGVPGFRVGTGPRGNYVSVGRSGIYYRTSINSRIPAEPAPPARLEYQPSPVIMEDVTGATAVSLAPTGAGDIVEQLNVAATRRGWVWPVAIGALALGLATLPYGLIVWALATPLCWWIFLRDASRRTVVLFYDVNGVAAEWFDSLVTNWPWMVESEKLWRAVQSGRVQTTHQHKTNAGASNLIERIPVLASVTGPRHVATNVTVPTLVAGKAALYFLPDRLLVREAKHYTDVTYSDLRVHGSGQRFIEGRGPLPRDARQVDQTWQYVNVKGGPDRRYKSNPALPIMFYGALDLTSSHGLNWHLQTSRSDAAPAIAEALASAPPMSALN